MKFIAVKDLCYPESGGIEDYGYIPKGTVCGTAVVEGCEAVLYDGKVVCDVDSGMAGEYFREVERMATVNIPQMDNLIKNAGEEFRNRAKEARKTIEAAIKGLRKLESEGKGMLYNVSVRKEEKKVLEMYYVMRGIKRQTDSLGNEKKVVCAERELSSCPDSDTIAQFLYESGADFMSLEQNYRFQDDLPFA